MASLLLSEFLLILLGPLAWAWFRSERRLIFGLLGFLLCWRERARLSWAAGRKVFEFCSCFLLERCRGLCRCDGGRGAVPSPGTGAGAGRGCCGGHVPCRLNRVDGSSLGHSGSRGPGPRPAETASSWANHLHQNLQFPKCWRSPEGGRSPVSGSDTVRLLSRGAWESERGAVPSGVHTTLIVQGPPWVYCGYGERGNEVC